MLHPRWGGLGPAKPARATVGGALEWPVISNLSKGEGELLLAEALARLRDKRGRHRLGDALEWALAIVALIAEDAEAGMLPQVETMGLADRVPAPLSPRATVAGCLTRGTQRS